MACTPGGTTTTVLGLCKPASGETNWAAAINGNWDIIDSRIPNVVYRAYLAGLTMSTAGSSTTMTISPGQCTDSGNTVTYSLASLINKTTGAWAVGSGNGGLDTGSIAASTWYHFYAIQRVDTGVVDVLFSLSASAPTMPTNYTLKRRIGSGKTDGSSNWTAFVQDGDLFQWLVQINDTNTTNPGTSAVTATFTVPTGVNVIWQGGLYFTNGSVSGGVDYGLLTDLATTDTAPSSTVNNFNTGLSGVTTVTGFPVSVRTNTSAQARYRISASDASVIIRFTTIGWLDRRGRDA